MSKPIVTGIMAYGMSGRIFHAPFLTTNSAFKLKAIVERHEKKAAKTYPGIVSYDSIDELLADDEIELIVVNTPNYLHFEHATQALQAGKHVLIEKPAAATSAEVRALYDLCRKVDRKVMVYQNRRYDSGFLSVKEVIESGRLGGLIEVHFRFDRYKATIGPKAFKEKKVNAANGLLFDLGPHLLDNAISLFGKPLSFDRVTAIHRENSEVNDYFSYRLNYPNQLYVYLTSSMLTAGQFPGFFVNGTLGTFVKNRTDVQEAQLDAGMLPNDPVYGIEPVGGEGELTTVGPDNQKIEELVVAPQGGYNQIFYAVYHTIRNNALFPVTEEQVAWQLELLEK
jgi:scyllo-inositol 2-dehydrogenase (NADP+)